VKDIEGIKRVDFLERRSPSSIDLDFPVTESEGTHDQSGTIYRRPRSANRIGITDIASLFCFN